MNPKDYEFMPMRDVVEFAHRLYDPSMTNHDEFGGLTDDDHTQYVILTPSSANRNLIQAADDLTPLILRNCSTQTTALFVCQNSTGAVGFQIESDFDVVVGSGLAGKNYTITLNGATTDGVITWVNATATFRFSHNVVIGNQAAGVDYTLGFEGENNSGYITWEEDEDRFKFLDDIRMVDQEAIFFDSVDTYIAANTDDPEDLVIAADQDILLQADNQVVTDTVIRAATSLYSRYYHLPLNSLNPAASGATFILPSTVTPGGWQLNASNEYLYFGTDLHSDWDAISDLTLEMRFELMTSNTGGSAGDTVDLNLNFYYKGTGEQSCKSQLIEPSIVVDDAPAYKLFKTEIALDYDAVGNVIEAGDVIKFRLNLNTTKSDCDNIIVNDMSIHYHTTHVGVEVGDV